MELLVKETVLLHKVLSRYLSTVILEVRISQQPSGVPRFIDSDEQDVMTQVFAAINHRLSEEYGKIELPTPEAKTRYVTEFRERSGL